MGYVGMYAEVQCKGKAPSAEILVFIASWRWKTQTQKPLAQPEASSQPAAGGWLPLPLRILLLSMR